MKGLAHIRLCMLWGLLLLGLLCLRGPTPGLAATSRTELTVGVLNYMGEQAAIDAWAPTISTLNAAMPATHFRLRALTIAEMTLALQDKTLDFVITNPGQYAVMEGRYGISRIAMVENDAPVASTIVARDPAITSLTDLRGRTLAITSVNAFGGFQVAWRELHDVGLDPPDDLTLSPLGSPMTQVADAVLSGRADAGVLRGCLLETLQSEAPETYGPLHAVGIHAQTTTPCQLSSRQYPGWPFAKTRTTDSALAKKVARALLAIPSTDDQKTWTVPLDYQPVLNVFRDLRIGPFARTGRVSLRDIFHDYRDWFIGAGFGLLCWGLYFVRVETLVRNRTRELAEANAQLRTEMAERKRAEEEAQHRQTELEHVARLSILGEMATAIAHELNQPLSAIATYGQGCLMRLHQGSATPADMELAAGQIVEQAQRAATVVQRIRAFVRKHHSVPEPISLATVITDCQTVFAATTTRVGISVTLDVAEPLPLVVADRVQIEQVLFNLVQNAVDALGTVPADARHIQIRLRAQKGGVELAVTDSGPGIGDDVLCRFAEPFFTTKDSGIGLGLALSRSIMEAHGGRLWAERTDDNHTRVLFWLPAQDTPANATGTSDTPPPSRQA